VEVLLGLPDGRLSLFYFLSKSRAAWSVASTCDALRCRLGGASGNSPNTGAAAIEEAPTPSENRSKVRYIIGPDGSQRLRTTGLPPPGTKRWTARYKAEIVMTVRSGLISLEDACSSYKLTVDELFSWQESYDRYGLRGLSNARLHLYRRGL
jgi:Protein of unknown function (DUF1153)